MKAEILSPEIQDYIDTHLTIDPNDLVLKGIPFEKSLHQSILDQIRSKNKSRIKLPLWYETPGIYFPPSLNLEQTSSEITAKYKADIVNGQSLIDITGGFGIDSHYFSNTIDHVIHVEQNENLSAMAKHNAAQFGRSNISYKTGDGIQVLKDLDRQFDWIYIDPSRRSDSKEKVFLLSDSTPNVKTFKGLFLKYAKHVLIKTSPLLDIKRTIEDLEFVKQVHIVAIQNEVKELLWVMERGFEGKPDIKTINYDKKGQHHFNFNLSDLENGLAESSMPLAYLYEPNAAILKSGAFGLVTRQLTVFKLHRHSHLYTSENLIDFPGRRFKILKTIPFNKKQFSKEGIKKANITTRNFPMSVHDIRKKLNIKDGGDSYLFFTTLEDGNKSIIVCSKI